MDTRLLAHYENELAFLRDMGAEFAAAFRSDLLEGVTTIQFQAPTVQVGSDGLSVTTERKTITAIPYYSWANRGQHAMQVWLPRKIKDIKLNY